MYPIVSSRIMIPQEIPGEIPRIKLIDHVMKNKRKLTYVHGAAGYGKTTLLSQIARAEKNAVWLTMDAEDNELTFLDALILAIRTTYSGFDFSFQAFLLTDDKKRHSIRIANSFVSALETLVEDDFVLVIDDLNPAIEEIRLFITNLLQFLPDRIKLCIGSREAPWSELAFLKMIGEVHEISQQELSFSNKEIDDFLGYTDSEIHDFSEGWPLALRSLKVLLESGLAQPDLTKKSQEVLFDYLFYECISRLPSETVNFLGTSSCFFDLEPIMLDHVTGRKSSKLILDSLAARNLFVIKTDSDRFRYHALFREYLLNISDPTERVYWQNKALWYHIENGHYEEAARYAILLSDGEALNNIIVSSYRALIRAGQFNLLHKWIKAYDDLMYPSDKNILAAKIVFYSTIGNFSEADNFIQQIMPLIGRDDETLYPEVMLHNARIVRNMLSFAQSNAILDQLILLFEGKDLEQQYPFVIEKVYNLCLMSDIKQAESLIVKMMDLCLMAGDMKIKAWYERYLTAVYFFAGRMKDAVACYEKSKALPIADQNVLDLHSIGMYAAKAYQMMGDDKKAITVGSLEMNKVIKSGRNEELWCVYLFYADLHFHECYKARIRGESANFEIAFSNLKLANEFALYARTVSFQRHWSRLLYLTSKLLIEGDLQEKNVEEILSLLEGSSDYFKTIAYGGLLSYFSAHSDYPSAIIYAKKAIEIGERSDFMMTPVMSYGFLAKVAIMLNDEIQASKLTERFLTLCRDKGIYEYLRLGNDYTSVLEFALGNTILPEFTEKLIQISGYKAKKAYIRTLGEFQVFPKGNMQIPLKFRSKKERELLAFLLDSGDAGVTKEQIYHALWSDSESDDIKKLIGVYFAHIKKDFSRLGIERPIINQQGHYIVDKSEMICDLDIFLEASKSYENKKDVASAKNVVSLYTGDYMSSFEAVWPYKKSMIYHEIYQSALNKINEFASTVN